MKKTAFALGLGGLVPFIGLGIWASASPPHMALAVQLQQGYAAAILSFLGALHWGAALVNNMPTTHARISLLWGVMPSLLSWAANTLPATQALPALAASIALCLLIDWLIRRWHAWPSWYLLLRVVLTVGALVGIGLSWVAIR